LQVAELQLKLNEKSQNLDELKHSYEQLEQTGVASVAASSAQLAAKEKTIVQTNEKVWLLI
jgi:cobalamin biosynthesis protein CbiG